MAEIYLFNEVEFVSTLHCQISLPDVTENCCQEIMELLYLCRLARKI